MDKVDPLLSSISISHDVYTTALELWRRAKLMRAAVASNDNGNNPLLSLPTDLQHLILDYLCLEPRDLLRYGLISPILRDVAFTSPRWMIYNDCCVNYWMRVQTGAPLVEIPAEPTQLLTPREISKFYVDYVHKTRGRIRRHEKDDRLFLLGFHVVCILFDYVFFCEEDRPLIRALRARYLIVLGLISSYHGEINKFQHLTSSYVYPIMILDLIFYLVVAFDLLPFWYQADAVQFFVEVMTHFLVLNFALLYSSQRILKNAKRENTKLLLWIFPPLPSILILLHHLLLYDSIELTPNPVTFFPFYVNMLLTNACALLYLTYMEKPYGLAVYLGWRPW